MTPTRSTFNWMLWPLHGDLSGASDEFIAEGFRVRLMGNRLEVSFEASGTCSLEAARAFAEQYIQVLGTRLVMAPALITEAEWLARTTPPFVGSETISPTREDRSRVARAVREARNELLASADEALRQCYDYRQDAIQHVNTAEAAYAVYKAMEILDERFGGEQNAVAVLGTALKRAKRVANEQRHFKTMKRSTPKASADLVESADTAIRHYEQYLLAADERARYPRGLKE